MRIVVHDYPGHAFPVQLSRELARRDHKVLHLYFEEFQSPKGPLRPKPEDPAGLRIKPISLGEPFQKYSFVKRWLQEQTYGSKLVAEVEEFRPNVIIGGNAPLDPQAKLQAYARREKVGFAFWLQDVYGVAIDKILRNKLGEWLGGMVGNYYMKLERKLWRQSDQIVLITEDFKPLLRKEGIPDHGMPVIENWASLADLPPGNRDNPWRKQHGLDGKFVFLYSGTLGLKHNPSLLVALATAFREDPNIAIVVVTEGIGRDWLAERKAAEKLDNLILLPFQSYDVLPDVIATGDVLVVLLEPDAGVYSVPSKTLTYLCAKRPILGGIPTNNLAARLIARNHAGIAVDPSDLSGFVNGAHTLLESPEIRTQMANSAREYAETAFDIVAIADRFEAVLQAAIDGAKAEPPKAPPPDAPQAAVADPEAFEAPPQPPPEPLLGPGKGRLDA